MGLGAGDGLLADVGRDPVQSVGDRSSDGGEGVGVAPDRAGGADGLFEALALGRQGHAVGDAALAGLVVAMVLLHEVPGRQVRVEPFGGRAHRGRVARLAGYPDA